MGTEDLPELHTRHTIVEGAELKLRGLVFELRREHELTPSEMFLILSRQIESEAQSCILAERRKRSK